MTSLASLLVGGSAAPGETLTDVAGAVLTISGGSWGLNEDQFFSGNQPVFTDEPDPVKVDPIQPASANWPGPNVRPPTNPATYSPVTPPTDFVGNQPVNNEPPPEVVINDIEPGSANWPAPVWIEEPPPENPG